MIRMRNLKEYRREANLRQKDLAKLLGVSKYTVSVWECGVRMPEWGMLEKLSDVLGVSVYSLIEWRKDGVPVQPPSERSLLVSDFLARFWELDNEGRDAIRLLIKEDGDSG